MPSNYGSLLQAIATQRIIERMGHNCQIIDYRNRDEVGWKAVRNQLKNKPNWSNSLIKHCVYYAFQTPGHMLAERKFDKMRRQFLELTAPCFSMEDLREKCKSDVVVTGSDQVWGPVINAEFDQAYFLKFCDSSNTKKIAYAASFGKSSFSDDLKVQFKTLLSDYRHITVREDKAVEILKELGIDNKGQVLDPTLLLTGDEWSELIKKDIHKDYILIYQIHNNPKLDAFARKLSSKTGLPLLRVTPSLHQISRAGRLVLLPDLDMFLSYLKNCRYLVTDSFHGTAFAINLNVQFIEILPENGTNSRNQSLLKMTGLLDRIATNSDDISIFKDEIDYKPVNEIIQNERQKSLLLLRNMIEK